MYSNKRKLILMLAFLLVLSACGKGDGGEKGMAMADVLFEQKNEFAGDASADGALLKTLEISKLGDYEIALKTDSRPYALEIKFSERRVTAEELSAEMQANACILLALIENADEIRWNSSADTGTGSQRLSVEDADKEYGDIKDYGTSSEKLRSLLTRMGYEQ
ncbi:MAG: DUF4825 domain-containing protein [Clostridiales Family XIII bacterium]|nr:DUF4825 domain-containing protein [Clostridiales Family XIII bacterium]